MRRKIAELMLNVNRRSKRRSTFNYARGTAARSPLLNLALDDAKIDDGVRLLLTERRRVRALFGFRDMCFRRPSPTTRNNPDWPGPVTESVSEERPI